ncbi:unnamed protein product [Ophioblennius macclurei]
MSDVEEDAVGSDVDGDEEDTEQVKHLTQEIISQGLSLLCRTANRLAHAYVRLDLREKGLNDIAAISSYIHIRFLDLSDNLLEDLSPLASLPHLMWLRVDNNSLSSFQEQPMAELKYLQWLSVASNRLAGLEGLIGEELQNINLTGNSIQNMNGFQSDTFDNLTTLELRGNDLNTTVGLELWNLKRLYLAQNAIKRLEGLERLEQLKILHIRDNQLDSLDGIENMRSLEYLNVRGNLIANEEALKSLSFVSKTLQALVLSDNQLADSSDYRLSVLIILPELKRLDKDVVSSEEREEALRVKEIREEDNP